MLTPFFTPLSMAHHARWARLCKQLHCIIPVQILGLVACFNHVDGGMSSLINPINQKHCSIPIVALNQQTKPPRDFIVVPIYEMRFKQIAVNPERSEGQGIVPIVSFKVVGRVILKSQRRKRQVVVSFSQPGPTMGSKSKVRISPNNVPFCGVRAMMYCCLHL